MASRKTREKRKVVYASAKKRAETHQSAGDRSALNSPEGIKWWTPKKAGIYRIDILPYEVKVESNPYADEGSLHYERTYFSHRGIGVDEKSYVCMKATFKKKCPICEDLRHMRRDPKADEDTIKGLREKERQLFNLIDLNDKEEGVQVWDISNFLFGKVLDAKIKDADEDDNYENFFHLEGGMTLKISLEEESFGGRKFLKCVNIEMKTRKEDYDEDILEQVFDLDALPKVIDADTLKAIYDGEDEDDDKPKKGKTKPKDEDEDEDEDETDDDEDEDEDEDEDTPPKKPKGKPAAKSKSKEEDDDDDSEDDDEEDDDEDEDAGDVTAGHLGIEIGSMVKHKKHGPCEVVHISKDGFLLKIKDDDDEVHPKIKAEDVTLVESDDDEDEDEPKKKLKAKLKGKKPAKEEENDNEEEDDTDDEDDDDD